MDVGVCPQIGGRPKDPAGKIADDISVADQELELVGLAGRPEEARESLLRLPQPAGNLFRWNVSENLRLPGRDAGDAFLQERGRNQRHAREKPRDHPGGLDRAPERAVVDRFNRQPTQPQRGPLGLLLAQRGEPAFQPIVQVGSRIVAAVTD